MAASSNDKAQSIIDKALLRYPRDHKIDGININCVRNVIGFVFADGYNIPAEETKKGFFRQLEPKTLIALAVLIRIRDIQGNSVSTIERLCSRNSSFISTIGWYHDVRLWKATLSVVSNSEIYLRFRKAVVDAIQEAESPSRPTPTQPTPAPPFRDPDVESGSVETITCSSCGPKRRQGGVVARNPETASAVSGHLFKRHPSAIAPRSPPVPVAPADGPATIDSAGAALANAAETPAQPLHTDVLGKRRRLEDAPRAAFRLSFILSDLSAAPRFGQAPTAQHGNGYNVDSAAAHLQVDTAL